MLPMTAAIATALRETADRALVRASILDHYERGANERLVAVALNISEALLRGAEGTEPLVAAYAEARAEWIASVESSLDGFTRAQTALKAALDAERELAHANPSQADAEAWTNERALQEAQTEKEAHA